MYKFISNEKIDMMLKMFIEDTMKLAEKVVNEVINKVEPEISAVTTKKRIQLYIDLSKDLNELFPLLSFQDVILDQGYDQEFVKLFEKGVSEELKVYRGNPEWEWNS